MYRSTLLLCVSGPCGVRSTSDRADGPIAASHAATSAGSYATATPASRAAMRTRSTRKFLCGDSSRIGARFVPRAASHDERVSGVW